jgi:hypothetical protein
MQSFTRGVAKVALVLALAGVGGAVNAAIVISEPQYVDDDTFKVLVELSAPLGVALDGLELSIDFDEPPLSLTQVVKQPGVPGNYESLQPKFGSISYAIAAAIPTGPLFELTFDVAAGPLPPSASIDVVITAFPTFTDVELDPIEGMATREITLIPEPATYALFGAGLVLLACARWRRTT